MKESTANPRETIARLVDAEPLRGRLRRTEHGGLRGGGHRGDRRQGRWTT
jgi:hypothetical protein